MNVKVVNVDLLQHTKLEICSESKIYLFLAHLRDTWNICFLVSSFRTNFFLIEV